MCSKVRFCITGFGPFNGVPDNPTTHLVGKIEQLVEQRGGHEELFTVSACKVLETSGEGSRQNLSELLQDARKSPIAGEILFLLHFGVHGGATQFTLETKAWNGM